MKTLLTLLLTVISLSALAQTSSWFGTVDTTSQKNKWESPIYIFDTTFNRDYIEIPANSFTDFSGREVYILRCEGMKGKGATTITTDESEYIYFNGACPAHVLYSFIDSTGAEVPIKYGTDDWYRFNSPILRMKTDTVSLRMVLLYHYIRP